jgi:hypothetical protein
MFVAEYALARNTKGGSIIVPLTSCLTGLGSAEKTTDIFCFYLQNRLIHTSPTGGQQYSDTSPFSIPWPLVATMAAIFLLFSKSSLVPTTVAVALLILATLGGMAEIEKFHFYLYRAIQL